MDIFVIVGEHYKQIIALFILLFVYVEYRRAKSDTDSFFK